MTNRQKKVATKASTSYFILCLNSFSLNIWNYCLGCNLQYNLLEILCESCDCSFQSY